MSHRIAHSNQHVRYTWQIVPVCGGRKLYFTTISPGEVCFGWHRAVRKGNMIYVSGMTAIDEVPGPTELVSNHEDGAASNNPATTNPRQLGLAPSGSGLTVESTNDNLVPMGNGFTVVSADGLDRSRPQLLNEDESEDEEPPPYDMLEPGGSGPHRLQSEMVPQVLHPNDAKQQAVVAMNKCIQAVESLHGKREDIAKVRMVITKHEDRRKVSEAFRECFSVSAPLTTAKEYSKKTGRAGVRVSEVGAALTILVIPGSLADPDLLVEVEAEAVLDSRR